MQGCEWALGSEWCNTLLLCFGPAARLIIRSKSVMLFFTWQSYRKQVLLVQAHFYVAVNGHPSDLFLHLTGLFSVQYKLGQCNKTKEWHGSGHQPHPHKNLPVPTPSPSALTLSPLAATPSPWNSSPSPLYRLCSILVLKNFTVYSRHKNLALC